MSLAMTALVVICVVFFVELLMIILVNASLKRWLMASNFAIMSMSATNRVLFLLAQAIVMA